MSPLSAPVDAYQRDGATVVRGAVPAELLRDLAGTVDEHLAAPSELAIVASAPDDPGYFVEDFCNWQRFPAYERLARHLAPLAASLMAASSVRLYHDHLLVKHAGTRQPTPWHQDQPYYNVEGDQVISAWVPIDPVPRAASLEIAAGSHRGPWLMPRTFLTREARWFADGSLAEIPADPQPVIGWELAPGDAVFFHALALHRSAGSVALRRVVSVRFLGDDARHAPRRWRTSPPFAGLDAELPAGAPFEHPLFPLLITP